MCTTQFHWQFHPAAHLFREILSSGKYGRILRTDAAITASPGILGIRWECDQAGEVVSMNLYINLMTPKPNWAFNVHSALCTY